MRTNTKPRFTETTHEGARAARSTPLQELRRSLMSCLLWEREFYEGGVAIADRIMDLAAKVNPEDLAALAVEARTVGQLRHAPLLLLTALIKHGKGAIVGDAIAQTIQRADELAELLSLYWRDGKRPLSKQLKRGLADAFLKFDEYQLAKYDRAAKVRLRDALFLCHAKPDTPERAAMWKRLVDGQLATPDTWEVALSSGKDKRGVFTRLLREGSLGYLALLRNLRNMVDAGVDKALIVEALRAGKGAARVLPFRYVAAARACPQLEPAIDAALLARLSGDAPFAGSTILLVDVSGSMNTPLSARSDLKRLDAAAALASMWPGEARVFTFSERLVEVPPRKGMSGVDAIWRSQLNGCTMLGKALDLLPPSDRLIVITDEQAHDNQKNVRPGRNYMINVASAKNGVDLRGAWTRINGLSENVLRYIREVETVG